MKVLRSSALAHCLLTLTLSACGAPPPAAAQRDALTTPLPVRPEAITPQSFWTYLTGTSNDPTYFGYLKFSILVDGAGRPTGLVWHPASYKFHADHLRTLPEFQGMSAQAIDAVALHTTGRQVLLGTMLAPKEGRAPGMPRTWDLQLMSQDPLLPEQVAEVFAVMRAALPVTDPELAYLPVAEQSTYVQREAAAFAQAGVPIAHRQGGATDVCYASGWGVGQVKVVRAGQLDAALRAGTIQHDTIVVLDEVPRELPVVGGIVVAQRSSPSSHPALLAQMLGIPFVYQKDATTNPRWLELERLGQPVFVRASGTTNGRCDVLVRDGHALTATEAATLASLKRPRPIALPAYEDVPADAVDLNDLGMRDARKVGAKAANVAELRRLIPANTITEGLALPVASFGRFLATATSAAGQPLQGALAPLFARLGTPSLPLDQTLDTLAQIRTLIEKAELAPAQGAAILQAVEARFPVGTRIKLRSSSNIEDQPEFNGAGLYESKGACVGDDALAKGQTSGACGGKPDRVLSTVKAVWSSLYSLKAWVARRYYGVDETQVGMGILVQRSFKGELANGVAISSVQPYTYRPSAELELEVVATGFPGEDDAVANPPAGKVPETTRITSTRIEQQVASTEVAHGRTLLDDAMYRQLFALMTQVHRHYVQALKPTDVVQFQLDFEWKLVDDGGTERIVIKQVRPVPAPRDRTQGLDRGLFLVGERGALLCSTPQEQADALGKLALQHTVQIDLGLHEIPLGSNADLPSPIERMRIDGVDALPGARAQITYGAWSPMYASNDERRTFEVTAPVVWNQADHVLRWSGEQRRSSTQPRLLAENAQSLFTSHFALERAGQSLAYQIVLGQDHCDGDAWQGYQPGSYLAQSWGSERKPPTPIEETFHAADGSALRIAVTGRTGQQGFDKTRFIAVDGVTIEGVLARPLSLSSTAYAVYAPGHHNFEWQYAFDLSAVADLTAEERSELAQRGISILLVSSSYSDDADVLGVSEAGVQTPLGKVTRER